MPFEQKGLSIPPDLESGLQLWTVYLQIGENNNPLFCLSIYSYFLLFASKPKAMATHASTLTWKIPWTEEPGGL